MTNYHVFFTDVEGAPSVIGVLLGVPSVGRMLVGMQIARIAVDGQRRNCSVRTRFDRSARKRGRTIRSEREKYDCGDAESIGRCERSASRQACAQRKARPTARDKTDRLLSPTSLRISDSIAELRQAKKNLLIISHAAADLIPDEIEEYRDGRWKREGAGRVETAIHAERFIEAWALPRALRIRESPGRRFTSPFAGDAMP